MRLLDRYVIRNFLQAYIYCIIGFISIWLIFDVSDNISTFLEDRVSLRMVGQYYLTQVPQILVILLPVSLLLALLFCLGRMSRTNEIVSMLTAGVSVPRVIAPLVLIGLLTTAASTALNWSLSPHADYARKTVLEANSRRKQMGITGQIFRNRTDNRTWFIQQFFPGANDFTTVQVLQQDANDNIVTNYFATRATYHPETKAWELKMLKRVNYDAAGNITKNEDLPSLTITDWSETPFRLSSANFRAEFLSVPELRDYLFFNSDFPPILLAPFRTHLQYRLALPWGCFIVVLIAAPLGIGYSRRGILTSVASAILLVFAMNFLTHLFLALGEGSRVPALVAAWTPDLLFATIGAGLLYFRATNREPPSFNLLAARRIVAR
ncbi:MAG: LptF/LptG family permease [Verrucomicrobiota bacterium]|nr:LptF/LptG family permease [Verrucomicrobiota bacterium]